MLCYETTVLAVTCTLYAKEHFIIYVGIQCFLVLKNSHHVDLLCVKDGTHTHWMIYYYSLDLGIFQHSPPWLGIKGDDTLFSNFKTTGTREEPQPPIPILAIWPIGSR